MLGLRFFSALLVLALAATGVVQLRPPSSDAATLLSVDGPGKGTWRIGQMWHGGEQAGGLVPAGTSIDLDPVNGSSLDVHAVGAGRIVKTCVADRQSSVFVDTVGIGVIGYVHLATGSIVTSGYVAKGQRLGTLATSFVRSECAKSWTGPHLHLGFPQVYDTLQLSGQTVERFKVLEFGDRVVPQAFAGSPRSDLVLGARAARFSVCADNLPGNVVTVRLTRRGTAGAPRTFRTATRVATARCITFANLDGPGRLTPGRLYVARAALNRAPAASWPQTRCFRPTRGQGLCDKARSS